MSFPLEVHRCPKSPSFDMDQRGLGPGRDKFSIHRSIKADFSPTMSSPYVVRSLVADQIAQAYPLVSIFEPKLTQEQWSDYAKALISDPRNGDHHSIITVQSAQCYIHGLSVYWLRPDLREGLILDIENFAVVDIAGHSKAAKTLLKALEDVARRLDCSCVTMSLLNPQMRKWLRERKNPAMDLFRAAGFRGEQLRLRKCF